MFLMFLIFQLLFIIQFFERKKYKFIILHEINNIKLRKTSKIENLNFIIFVFDSLIF